MQPTPDHPELKAYPFDFSLKGKYVGSRDVYAEGVWIILRYIRPDGITIEKKLDPQLDLSAEYFYRNGSSTPLVTIKWTDLGCFTRSFYDDQGKLVYIYEENKNTRESTEIWCDGPENILARRFLKDGVLSCENGASIVLIRMYQIERREFWEGTTLRRIDFFHPTKGLIAQITFTKYGISTREFCLPVLLDLLDLKDWQILGITNSWTKEIQKAEQTIIKAGSLPRDPKTLYNYALELFNKKVTEKNYKNEKFLDFQIPNEISEEFETLLRGAGYDVKTKFTVGNLRLVLIQWD